MSAQLLKFRTCLGITNKPLDESAHRSHSRLFAVGFEESDLVSGERNRDAILSQTATRAFAANCPRAWHFHTLRMNRSHTTWFLAMRPLARMRGMHGRAQFESDGTSDLFPEGEQYH